MAKVFITYSHDSNQHKARVRDLAVRLRTYNIEVVIDQDILGGPDEGWYDWSQNQVRQADYVLIACTQTYCAYFEGTAAPGVGQGATTEIHLIKQHLAEAKFKTPKFRAILFEESDDRHVPEILRTYHRFRLYLPDTFIELVAWLNSSATPTASLAPPTLQWPTPISRHVWDMANRQHVTMRLEQLLTGQSAKRILLLRASSNSGKTHLICELKKYAKRLSVPHAALDCKGELPLDELINYLVLDLSDLLPGARSAAAAARYSNLIAAFRQLIRPVLLSFDTYEQASAPFKHWLENQLLPRLDLAPGVCVVVAGQQIPARTKQIWASLADEIALEPITGADDWLSFCQRKGHSNVKRDHLEALALATGGNPGQISALLETMVGGLNAQARAGA